MTETQTLTPARHLAETNKARFPNESVEYRAARNALLVEEIELRRHIERVAAQRRALPSGGRLPRDFELASEKGPVRMSTLFGDKDTLMVTADVRPATPDAVSRTPTSTGVRSQGERPDAKRCGVGAQASMDGIMQAPGGPWEEATTPSCSAAG